MRSEGRWEAKTHFQQIERSKAPPDRQPEGHFSFDDMPDRVERPRSIKALPGRDGSTTFFMHFNGPPAGAELSLARTACGVQLSGGPPCGHSSKAEPFVANEQTRGSSPPGRSILRDRLEVVPAGSHKPKRAVRFRLPQPIFADLAVMVHAARRKRAYLRSIRRVSTIVALV